MMPTQGIGAESRILRIATVVVLLSFAIVGGLTAPWIADAQQTKVPRVGVFWASTMATASSWDAAFKQGLGEHGYVEGQNIVLERRYGDSRIERMAEIARELVQMNVDVIVISTDPAIAAVKRQTRSIPIVMVNSTDPVGTGFVASLARPGGNVTGTSSMSPELGAKRLDILRAVVPKLSRAAVMWNPDVRGALLDYKGLEGPARSLRMQLQSIEVSQADDFARAFSAILDARAEAMIVITPNPVTVTNRGQLIDLVQRNRLPAIYGNPAYADAGGLMAYGTSLADLWRRAATYVDKILKGAKPGELPVEQPTKFELVINLKAARAIGLNIPPSLLQQADRLIQ